MSQLNINGGCLCGEIQFEVSGDPKTFYHCHCKRCRKASGTGHATNLLLTDATLTWKKGQQLLKFYKVPDAERFGRQFCSNCGSAVARFVPELNAVMIPAGSMDSDVPVKPQARIFWDSRAEWTCSGDALPMFAEYPPR